MMNDYVPDLDKLFDQLKMNMQQSDAEARVAQYFIDFDRVVEEHGLVGVCWAGKAPPNSAHAKMRYRLLMRRLQPETARLNVSVRTTAGPVMLRRLACLVLDADEPEFLLGHRTMQSLGIDVERQMEQLAGGDRIAELDGDGDLPAEPTIDFSTEIAEVHDNLERMLAEAEREADDASWAAELRALGMRFDDVWRIAVGPDPPANIEPMRVELN
ncbi:unnamed protein product [Phytophthora lilii]|uniref:Unnamed protein product n=1 Tax=Phytophthora lilii TaxID=2077276 RepID=A0A9W6YEW4_9STRA|nr:unnamed protein product [Phytophthora lilii]